MKTSLHTPESRVLVFATSLLCTGLAYAQDPVGNACPPEGCEIAITDVSQADEELKIVWDANFLPDVSRNHIHVFWDTFKAEEVSGDAEANGFTQGDWVPTSDYPEFITQGAMSVANRGASTTICVTAADRDHAVLDAAITQCVDVSDKL